MNKRNKHIDPNSFQRYIIYGEWEAVPDRQEKDGGKIMLTRGTWLRMPLGDGRVNYLRIGKSPHG